MITFSLNIQIKNNIIVTPTMSSKFETIVEYYCDATMVSSQFERVVESHILIICRFLSTNFVLNVIGNG